jgi:hypothetical protein
MSKEVRIIAPDTIPTRKRAQTTYEGVKLRSFSGTRPETADSKRAQSVDLNFFLF